MSGSVAAGTRLRQAFYAAYGTVQKINDFCAVVACVLVVLMTVLNLWEAITRYFFLQPATWTYPVTSYMLLYCIYLAVAYTLQKGGHVSVEFVVELVPPTARRWMERMGHLLGLVFTLVMLQQSARLFVRHAFEGPRDLSMLSLPLAPVSFGLLLGFSLMTVTYVLVLVDSLLRSPSEPTLQEQARAEGAARLQYE